MLRIKIALNPVVRGAVPIPLQRCCVPGLAAIEFRTFQQHSPDAIELRAVRVFRGFAPGVVLAMDRHPLPGHHPGGQPQPEAQEMAGDGMQIEGAMGLVAVQENRDRRDGDVGQAQRHKRVTPPGETKQAKVHCRLQRKIRMRKR
ncbi:hypothetical protein D9M69_533200 [compost metagenome]